ncbi:MAG: capsule biosynthesis protein CapB [Polyangiaceae bacterium]|nr:capsule biosynthesis protein CapB [Polyangiaceae bacterium]
MTPSSPAEAVLRRLEGAVPPLQVRLRRPTLAALAGRVLALTAGTVDSPGQLVNTLLRAAAEALTRRDQLEQRSQTIAREASAALSDVERSRHLVELLGTIVGDHVELLRDLGAMRRWLDHEAILDRIGGLAAAELDEVEVACLAAAGLVTELDSAAVMDLDPAATVTLALNLAKRAQVEVVVVAALRAATAILGRLPGPERLMVLGLVGFRELCGWVDDERREPWIRAAALEAAVKAAPNDARTILASALAQREGRDGMIVRSAALRLTATAESGGAWQHGVAWTAAEDPSEHVRQTLACSLVTIGGRRAAEHLTHLATQDPAERVRAFALRELYRGAARRQELARAAFGCTLTLLDAAATEPDKVGRLIVLVMALELPRIACGVGAPLPAAEFVEPLSVLVQKASLDPDLVERLAAVLRAMEVAAHPELEDMRRLFAGELADLVENHRVVVELFPETPTGQIEKALAVAARDDLSVSLDPLRPGRFRLVRGEPQRFRWWRWLFELRTPEPDKRQAFLHSYAAADRSQFVVPPFGMGEVTPTRVPGMRRMIAAIKSWGVFLPRVDDFFAALSGRQRERRVVTTLGTLVIAAPPTAWQRWKARGVLVLRYVKLARLREVALAASDAKTQRSYVGAFRDLGFAVHVENTSGTIGGVNYELGTTLTGRYLSMLAGLPTFIDPIVNEFLRPTGSSALHLSLVAWTAFAWMIVRAAWIRARIEHSRRAVPLTVGGWGSRGKSGSERIKSALFHALRFDVVVKTTGCEAMFIHARRDRPAREIFVYRPYGKATIWEQRALLGYAESLHAQVFMWECMALRPQFVELLESEWMRDDVTTLTNAYPDHEDVMGPSGEDVARVIATFMPHGGTVLTAEQELLPIIDESARRRGNRFVPVPDLEALLLPADMLARYPYAEHPRNIALALALAEHFGVDREWALAKMADHVVPDLGVLKTYPTVVHRGRSLTFMNGMSANERAGFMSNWVRLELDKIDPDEHAGTVTVAVVNNRADRVPRSRVFAEILTRDVTFDHVVVIGSNLSGMAQFLEESLDRWLATVSVGSETKETAHGNLHELIKRLRVVHHPKTLGRRLDLILEAAGVPDETRGARVGVLVGVATAPGEADAESVARDALATGDAASEANQDALPHLLRLVREYRSAHEQLSRVHCAIEKGDPAQADRLLRAWLRALALARNTQVTDYHATGDQIIDHVARQVPPGHDARVLGCQNIKGTGLDFAYRWVSVGDVDTALRRLESEPGRRADAIRWLRSHGDYGLCDSRMARARVAAIRDDEATEWDPFRADLNALVAHLDQVVAARLTRLAAAPKRSWFAKALDTIEPFVDHLDSIRRHRTSRRIMQDLFAQRVSQSRAAVLLRELTDRSKGGWLAKDFENWKKRRRKRRA